MKPLLDIHSDLYKKRLAKEVNAAIAKLHTVRYGEDRVLLVKFSKGTLMYKAADGLLPYHPVTDLDEFYDANTRDTICASREQK